jgi:hypothetical protein
MTELLRTMLGDHNWRVCNESPLPVLCVQDPGLSLGVDQLPRYRQWASQIQESGKAWLEAVRLADGNSALQIRLSNFETNRANLRILSSELERVRKGLK